MMNDWMQFKREAEIQLLEEMAEYDEIIVDRLHRSTILDSETQALIKWRNFWYGSLSPSREVIEDGRGGLLPIEDMTPIMQIGNSEPIGYFDKRGNWYPAEQPRSVHYEDALVEYEQC